MLGEQGTAFALLDVEGLLLMGELHFLEGDGIALLRTPDEEAPDEARKVALRRLQRVMVSLPASWHGSDRKFKRHFCTSALVAPARARRRYRAAPGGLDTRRRRG